MKKLVIIIFFLAFTQISKAQRNSDKYYVFTALEQSFYNSHQNEYIVSNVAYNKCNEYLGVSAKTQFNDYWHAFIKKGNAVNSINISSFNFETFDQAEDFRRKKIAEYNSKYFGGGSLQKHKTIIVNDFTFLCK